MQTQLLDLALRALAVDHCSTRCELDGVAAALSGASKTQRQLWSIS